MKLLGTTKENNFIVEVSQREAWEIAQLQRVANGFPLAGDYLMARRPDLIEEDTAFAFHAVRLFVETQDALIKAKITLEETLHALKAAEEKR